MNYGQLSCETHKISRNNSFLASEMMTYHQNNNDHYEDVRNRGQMQAPYCQSHQQLVVPCCVLHCNGGGKCRCPEGLGGHVTSLSRRETLDVGDNDSMGDCAPLWCLHMPSSNKGGEEHPQLHVAAAIANHAGKATHIHDDGNGLSLGW